MIHDHKEAMQADQSGKPVFWRSRYGLGLLVFGIAATYFLATEHRAHFFGALPFLILMACPLMHVFTHGGHGGPSGSEASNTSSDLLTPKIGEKS